MTRTIPPPKSPKLSPKEGAPGGTLMQVPVADLHVLKGLNVRVDLPNLDELVSSIESNGFYPDKPLTGYVTADDKVVVIDGHRRLAAVTRLNDNSLDGAVVETVPVVIKDESATAADLTIAMVQSASGEPLTMFEKGIAVRRLLADGMTKDDIARRLGNSVKTIDNWLLVAQAPAKARDLLLDNQVTSTQVLRAMVHPDKAVATLQAMVEKATGAGRTRARPSDALVAKPQADPDAAVVRAEFTEQYADTLAALDDQGPEADVSPQGSVSAAPADEAMTFDVTIVKDAGMGAVLKQIATEIRKLVPHDQGEDDFAFVDGTVSVSITLTQPEKPKAARRRKATAVPAVEDEGVPAELAHAIPADDEL